MAEKWTVYNSTPHVVREEHTGRMIAECGSTLDAAHIVVCVESYVRMQTALQQLTDRQKWGSDVANIAFEGLRK